MKDKQPDQHNTQTTPKPIAYIKYRLLIKSQAKVLLQETEGYGQHQHTVFSYRKYQLLYPAAKEVSKRLRARRKPLWKDALQQRWLMVLLAGLVSILLLYLAIKYNWLDISPDKKDDDLTKILIDRVIYSISPLLFGSLVGYVIWLFRDQNNKQQLENQRKDTNLKDFQQLAKWATCQHIQSPTTAELKQLEDKPTINNISRKDGDESLQIAAIYQLEAFLRGDYGDYFRQPAFALISSVWLALMQDIRMPPLTHPKGKKLTREQEQKKYKKWQKYIYAKNTTPLAKAITRVLCIDKAKVFRKHADQLAGLELSGIQTRLFDYQPLEMELVNANGIKLIAADLRGAKLEGIKLQKAQLQMANLQGADLQGADLEDAYLQDADIQGAYLEYAKLQGAKLQDAKLQEAYLKGANLQAANLQDANLEYAKLEYAKLQGANLEYAKLQEAYLKGANLSGAYLQDANLSGADLQHANLSGAYLQETNLSGAHLQDAYLQGAKLERAYLQGAFLEKANLQRAKLQGANLERAFPQDADLQGANLQGAKLQEAYLSSADLQGAKLQNAYLERAYLQDADLEGAKLQDAHLHSTDLRGAKLQDTDLQGAKLYNIQCNKSSSFTRSQTNKLTGIYLFTSPKQPAYNQPPDPLASHLLRLWLRKHCDLQLDDTAYSEYAKNWQQAGLKQKVQALRVALNPPQLYG